MAGISEAGTGVEQTDFALSSRRFFSMIAWLRWRIFLNAVRGKGGKSELAVKFLSYPFLALMVIGPAAGAGFGAWYFVNQGMDAYLAIPLWIIFVLWQVIGVSTSASGPSFDMNALTRFPIRYRDYLLMRLWFGLLDPPTVVGFCCLMAMSLGIAIAAPVLFPWAAVVLAVYGACNLFFSRMVYQWLERWLAQRRTREMLTVVLLVGSLGIQVVSQYAGRIGSHHKQLSPWMETTAHVLLTINWALPPGLAAFSMEHMHSGAAGLALETFAALAVFSGAFLLMLHLRLRAQYMGENLSEAPVAAAKAPRRTARLAVASTAATTTGKGFALLSGTVAGLLIKEVRLLLRSGPKLYTLLMPVFIVCLFSLRGTGMEQAGLSHNHVGQYLFTYGCAYMQLIFVVFMYNALGSDGAGVQFYFIAPVRIREVMLAKNLMIATILVIEVVAIYIASLFLAVHTSIPLAVATLAWTLFTFMVNVSIGNVRSITSPKGMDPTKVRKQNVSTVNSFISLAVVIACCALGQVVLMACRWLGVTDWAAAAIFFVLAALACGLYWIVLLKVDDIATEHVEDLSRELCKA